MGMADVGDADELAGAELGREREDASGHGRGKPEPASSSELDFGQIFGILRRRSGLVVLITALGSLLVAVVALLISPKYTARAQVEVVLPPVEVHSPFGLTDESIASQIDSQLTMLTSRNHLQRVLDSFADPTAAPGEPNPGTDPAHRSDNDRALPATAEGAANSAAGDVAALSLNEFMRRIDIWTTGFLRIFRPPAQSVDELERRLTVNQERRSRIISVSYTSVKPEKAAATANRIVQLYVDRQNEQRRAYTSSELTRVSNRVAELKTEMERAGTELGNSIRAGAGNDIREGEVRLRELEHDATANWQLYDRLLERQRALQDAQQTIVPDLRILSLASVPDRPSSTHPILFIVPAMIGFLLWGSLLAVFVERLDRGLRSERDINRMLGIPCIGLVPQLPRLTRLLPHEHLLSEPWGAYAEAIRSLVAALQLAGPHDAARVFLVSSSVPGEGKTTLAVSLAAYAAVLGRRVLLIDLDFRNPSILRQLKGRPQRGMLDLLLYGRTPAEVIQRIPEWGLDYIPMARCPGDPLALFAGQEMPRLLRRLGVDYDWVLIDSPPLLGVAEARLLTSMVDKVLFVVKWGSTRREVVQNALNLLRYHKGCEPAEAPSALVAQVNLKKHARYRYGDVGEWLVKYRNYYSRAIKLFPL